jgi:uncharacterized OB-fold protein
MNANADLQPLPRPELTPVNQPHWNSLLQGRLTFQACACGHRWLPPRADCPNCLGQQWTWQEASGRATLVSWVVFHTPPHEAFTGRTPYTVAVVELEEGPRMITNIADAPDGRGLAIGQPLQLAIHREDDLAIARFVHRIHAAPGVHRNTPKGPAS